jgi:uncharacterized protein involved in type VI secretion and phage assembly
MATGYGGTYKAVVVDNSDPTAENRLNVMVPDLGIDSAWAKPLSTGSGVTRPAVGEEVFVQFEDGDTDHPVWHRDGSAASSGGQYPGVYAGTVLDNLDPNQSGRLQVQVPQVSGAESAWAVPAASLGTVSDPPAVGTGVWVQFEGGDPAHPEWTGLQ